MTSRKKGYNIIHFPRISIGFTCSSCFQFLKTDSLLKEKRAQLLFFFSARQAYHSLLWNGICFEHWAIIKIISFSRDSLWVGRLISVRSVAVTASNDSDLLFYLIHGNLFCASKLANLSAVTGNVFTFHLASQDKFCKKKAHTHAHASFYRKFAEGKYTEGE